MTSGSEANNSTWKSSLRWIERSESWGFSARSSGFRLRQAQSRTTKRDKAVRDLVMIRHLTNPARLARARSRGIHHRLAKLVWVDITLSRQADNARLIFDATPKPPPPPPLPPSPPPPPPP